MGLDSVELLVALEKRFSFSMPDIEAEQISTVADMAVCICRHRNIPLVADRSESFQTLLNAIICCLDQQHSAVTVTIDTLLQAVWPPEKTAYKHLEHCLSLLVPRLVAPRPRSRISAWLLGSVTTSYATWQQHTVAALTDWILALNQEKLLPQPMTLYEVQRVVVGITSAQSGVPIEEIRLADRFVYDLGID